MFHLKSVTRISRLSGVTDAMMPVLIELWIFPVVAVVLSLREKRYWCRKICPLGALVRFFAKFNPFFKPTVKKASQIAKENPRASKRNPFCSDCSKLDLRNCERVCPQGLGPLKAQGSAECTKCLECYVQCENDMVQIKKFQTPDAVLSIKHFFKKRLTKK
jgi:polyferredoxin